MTCIATDGKTMAADGLLMRDDLIVTTARRKLFHAKDGSVVGCAGDGAAIALAREWFKSGEPKDTIPVLRGQDFAALILRRDGRVELLDGLFTTYDCEAPATLGSGDAFALGALHAGATPRRAVEIACLTCATVGGTVRTMKPTKRKP
ncbi:MAG: hypothetical protein WKF79_00195 [Nocardioides sp.]